MNYLSVDTRGIKKFKDANARKVRLGNDLMRLSHVLRDTVLHIEFESFVQHLLVQNIFRHYQEALVFAMRGEPTMCFSMVRIGTEGCRDLLRILEDAELAGLYVDGPHSKENRKRWRKSFRFMEDRDAPLLHLYNLCSDFGVHARMPLSDPVGEVTGGSGEKFISIGQRKHSKTAFVLAAQAIEFSNIRIMQSTKPLIDPTSPEAEKLSRLWWEQFNEVSEQTKKYFEHFHKGTWDFAPSAEKQQ